MIELLIPATVACRRQMLWSALIFLAKFIHPPSRVNDLLFAGIKGMTGRTHLDMEFFVTQGGTSHEFITTTANNLNILISRMDIRFHNRPT